MVTRADRSRTLRIQTLVMVFS